jgi:lysophospholipase L1-like esterase
MMKLALLLGGFGLFALFAYWSVTFYRTVQVSKKLIHGAAAYEKPSEDASIPVLVLGDSTGVGVGASRSEESLAGLVAARLGATSLENYAASGAVVADLPGQISQAKLAQYRLILVQIGGNDMIAFHSPKKTAAALEAALKSLPEADRVVVISAGDVGGATLFPLLVRPFHTWETRAMNEAFEGAAARAGKTFVNFSKLPATETINEDPETYLAEDGLHPSSAGYALWLESIAPHL